MRLNAANWLEVISVIVVLAVVPSGGPALAFDVDTTVDGPDDDPGDGICATAIGPCTLRAAIEEANALGGAHTINLPQGTYHGGDYVITADISLVGIRGGPANTRPWVVGGGPTFTVQAGATVSMGDVSILFGDNGSGSGCLENNGELELVGVGLYGCTGQWGGAIQNWGTLTMTDGEVEDSTDTGVGGGGGVWNSGTATLTEVAFRRNSSAADGGAIFTYEGSLQLTDCWLDDNTALRGGGLFTGSRADLLNVTVSRNTSTGPDPRGGGIYSFATLSLTNVTIFDNYTNPGGRGGGVYLDDTSTLVNVTIYDNSSGLATGPSATVQVANTLFALNGTGGDCDLDVPITSFGHNLQVFSNSCGLNGPGDLPNSSITFITFDPLPWGGFGETLALHPSSPGIDDGDNSLAPPTDQNGVERWDGDGDGITTADIGAYEYGPFFADGFEAGDTSRWSSATP